MINRKDLRDLRSGLIEYILLPDGYILSMNQTKQYYISRGAKKRYFLSEEFINNLCNKRPTSNNMNLIVRVLKQLEEITLRLKKESFTRIKIQKLVEEIRKNYE